MSKIYSLLSNVDGTGHGIKDRREKLFNGFKIISKISQLTINKVALHGMATSNSSSMPKRNKIKLWKMKKKTIVANRLIDLL